MHKEILWNSYGATLNVTPHEGMKPIVEYRSTDMSTSHHWNDQLLLNTVLDDLLKKEGWSDLRPVLLELPLCGECAANRSDSTLSAGMDARTDCCDAARGVIAKVKEVGCAPSQPAVSKLVFAVSGRWPLPTGRLGDVVAAAEEHVRGLGFGEASLNRRPRVLVAFCDGPSIIYYTVSSGVDLRG